MRWTEEQQKVIDLRDRNILVSAGDIYGGSGSGDEREDRGCDREEAPGAPR